MDYEEFYPNCKAVSKASAAMKRMIVVFALSLWLPTASADVDEALDAYQRGEYDNAMSQFEEAAGKGNAKQCTTWVFSTTTVTECRGIRWRQ